MYALATGGPMACPRGGALFNVYGPREHCGGIPAGVIPRCARVLAGQPPIIFGNGEQTRDYTWVDDSVAGLIAATKCDALVGDIVHLGRGQETSVNTLAQLVLQKLGREDLEPIYLGSDRPGDVPRLRANTAKARNLFGFDPQVSVEEGLDRFIAWVQEYGPEPVAWAERQAVENW